MDIEYILMYTKEILTVAYPDSGASRKLYQVQEKKIALNRLTINIK